MGKLVVILLLLTAIAGGVGIWYTQTRAYYDVVEGPVTLTLWDGEARPLPATDVRAIASVSSPLGFRACFAHDLEPAAVQAEPRVGAAPTIAPGWFECFDADAVGALLASGEARAFTAWENAAYGVDRVVALTADGRGWAWHELNDCGQRSFDGTPVGEACPDRETFEPMREGAV